MSWVSDVEAAGLVKFDFLGLATLTILEMAKEFIRTRHADRRDFTLEGIPLNDRPAYQLMSEGNAGQARIPGKHGGPPQAYSWLTVLVDDRPGQIARLLTEIGEIGVNLEDLRLDHSSGQNVGMVEISVLPSAHDLLVEALSDRGWRVLQ